MAKASVEHRKRKIAEGAKQISVVLDPDYAQRFERLAARHGGESRERNKRTIEAALRALEGANDLDLPAALERAAEDLRNFQRQAKALAAAEAAAARFGKKKQG